MRGGAWLVGIPIPIHDDEANKGLLFGVAGKKIQVRKIGIRLPIEAVKVDPKGGILDREGQSKIALRRDYVRFVYIS